MVVWDDWTDNFVFEPVIDQYVVIDKQKFMLGQSGYVTIFEIYTLGQNSKPVLRDHLDFATI